MAVLGKNIGFIGGGNMAEAIAGGMIQAGVCTAEHIWASDVSGERLEYLSRTYGIHTGTDNGEVFAACDIIILAVKPQIIDPVLTDLAEKCRTGEVAARDRLIVSIAAGIPISFIESRLGKHLPVVRVMPNTPALALSGMSGMSVNASVSEQDRENATRILESIGKVLILNEMYLDAVTAVSGSGPAYVFYFLEAMMDGAAALGLSSEDAETLTLETLKGAVTLLEARGETPADLRRKVTSPGGTTEAALNVMTGAGMADTIAAAMKAARDRARELSPIEG
ncbi:MAG: pyrroline-5-carboxylate reductase [Thermodesulfobacteriota bacterium]|nr:pyrroline-5-carboxylate reductase [Thermodesulfobacteriota bacterium]